MIVATRQQSANMLERIRKLEWDNRILRDMMDVASQRVAQSQLGGGEQEEVNGNGGNENRGNRHGGNGNGGNGNEKNENGGNGHGGNGNGGNGNGGRNGYNFGGFMPARECTYKDFLKCQPLSFNGTERVVG
ncbi:hypothetical protein Tco_1008605 [Tanacetum coccineum]